MLNEEQKFPSDLTNHQWDYIKKIVPDARLGGRPRTTDVREVINAIFYLVRSGCAWRYLPKVYPPWQTVYDYFKSWQELGIWQLIYKRLRKIIRKKFGRKACTRVLIIDSQSVKAQFGEKRGYDGFKKVRGRKRHILVDTLGLIHALKIEAANLHDGLEGRALFDLLDEKQILRLKCVHADHGYRGQFADHVKKCVWICSRFTKKAKKLGSGS